MELGQRQRACLAVEIHSTRVPFSISSGVSWGELTSSKLIAHSYEEASPRALIPYPLSLVPHTYFFLVTKRRTAMPLAVMSQLTG